MGPPFRRAGSGAVVAAGPTAVDTQGRESPPSARGFRGAADGACGLPSSVNRQRWFPTPPAQINPEGCAALSLRSSGSGKQAIGSASGRATTTVSQPRECSCHAVAGGEQAGTSNATSVYHLLPCHFRGAVNSNSATTQTLQTIPHHSQDVTDSAV